MSSKSLLRSSTRIVVPSSSSSNNNSNNSSSTSSIHSSRTHLKVAPATTMTMEKNMASLLFASFSCQFVVTRKKRDNYDE